LDFEEAEAKELLRQAGIPVPPGEVCRDAEAAAAAVGRLGRCAVKAQVPSGKRGKAGGIRLVNDPREARDAAKAILGMEIAGHRVERVLVEKCADIAQELYVAVVNDVATRAPMVLFSRSGGMDVEDMAERIVRIPVDIDRGFQASPALDEDIGGFVKRLYELYVQTDAELLEVNPLVRLKGGGLLALDCKLTVDDASLFRQPGLAGKGAGEKLTELERRGRELGLKYIELPGNVGVLANGAGLTMTTMDVIEHCGGAPANFLEIGGDAYTKAEGALGLVLANPRVKSLIINFCGAFARTDVMAGGVVEAWQKLKPSLPVFFSVHGTGEDEAVALIKQKLGMDPFDRMEDAVRAAVEAAGVEKA
jgi:succinyl-CoA synthetase beta subunit